MRRREQLRLRVQGRPALADRRHMATRIGHIGPMIALLIGLASDLRAQTPAPSVLDPNLAVRTVASGFDQPIGMAFLGPNDFLVLEKATGKVKRVRLAGGRVRSSVDVLDLPVNSASERGLLSIALHPGFPRNRGVYLYWTESSTGADSTDLAEVGNPNSPYPPGTPLPMGNRVDRFVWNPRSQRLDFDRNIIVLRAFQADPGQPLRGNHDGGVIRFGLVEDGGHGRGHGKGHDDNRAKLYIIVGDLGRRGQMQNLENGPPPGTNPLFPDDDQFGGPEPDPAHLSGVVLRLNGDGTTPTDNPFYDLGSLIAVSDPEVGRTIQKVFGYGIRNSFGMAIDPKSGDVWTQENGDDSFSEINRVVPGFNGGWVQIMGPVERIAEFKAIETGTFPLSLGRYEGLQQLRWPPMLIADTPSQALMRLFSLPGSRYTDPVFSWRFEVAPAGIGFLNSRALGPQYESDLFVGAARDTMQGGYLFRFNLTGNRRQIAVDDRRLVDRVADNQDKHSVPDLGIIESESLLFGRNFGVGTDIRTGPNGNLFVVSLSHGSIYEIHRPPPKRVRPRR